MVLMAGHFGAVTVATIGILLQVRHFARAMVLEHGLY
jgi:hypothetical protein